MPERTDPARFRRKFSINRPFAIYIGRIDENKGCKELFDYFQRYAAVFPRGLDLVLVGSAVMPVPKHPRIHHLGFLSDEDKFDALAASDLLIMPSYYESLSMVALEAWALGRPVLANGRCDVLKGQCIRSNAGLYYERYEEFVEALYSLESNGPLHARLGQNGRDYFRRHYAWPVIERKYLDMLAAAAARRRRAATRSSRCRDGWRGGRKTLRPAAEILAEVPAGPVVPGSRRPAAMSAPHGRDAAASIRSSRRSDTATPSATRCSASSAPSRRRLRRRRSSSRPPIRGSRT